MQNSHAPWGCIYPIMHLSYHVCIALWDSTYPPPPPQQRYAGRWELYLELRINRGRINISRPVVTRDSRLNTQVIRLIGSMESSMWMCL